MRPFLGRQQQQQTRPTTSHYLLLVVVPSLLSIECSSTIIIIRAVASSFCLPSSPPLSVVVVCRPASAASSSSLRVNRWRRFKVEAEAESREVKLILGEKDAVTQLTRAKSRRPDEMIVCLGQIVARHHSRTSQAGRTRRIGKREKRICVCFQGEILSLAANQLTCDEVACAPICVRRCCCCCEIMQI